MCARLETQWRLFDFRLAAGDIFDHLPTAHERGHRVEQLVFAPQNANPIGPERFMCRKRREIDAQFFDVEPVMKEPLRTIGNDVRANGMRLVCDKLDGEARSQHIRDVCDCDNLRAGSNLLFYFGCGYPPVLVQEEENKIASLLTRELLPWEQVAVMLRNRQNDFVALLEDVARKGPSDQIDGLCGIPAEHDLVVSSTDMVRDDSARLLVCVSRNGCQLLRTAMRVGVVIHIPIRRRLYHTTGLLRGRRTIGIHQAPPFVSLGNQGKVFCDIKHNQSPPRRERETDSAHARFPNHLHRSYA